MTEDVDTKSTLLVPVVFRPLVYVTYRLYASIAFTGFALMWAVFRYAWAMIIVGIGIDILRLSFWPKPRIEALANLTSKNWSPPWGKFDLFRREGNGLLVFWVGFIASMLLLFLLLRLLPFDFVSGPSSKIMFRAEILNRPGWSEGIIPSNEGLLLCLWGIIACFVSILYSVKPGTRWAIEAERRYLDDPSLFEKRSRRAPVYSFAAIWLSMCYVLGIAKWGPALLLLSSKSQIPMPGLSASFWIACMFFIWAAYLAPLEFDYLACNAAVAEELDRQFSFLNRT